MLYSDGSFEHLLPDPSIMNIHMLQSSPETWNLSAHKPDSLLVITPGHYFICEVKSEATEQSDQCHGFLNHSGLVQKLCFCERDGDSGQQRSKPGYRRSEEIYEVSL